MAEERVQRRLAAILAADVVGYSKRTRFRHEHLEKCGLGDEARAIAEARTRAELQGDQQARVLEDLEAAHAGLRQGVELGAQTHLDQRVDAARHEAFAAEFAGEVRLPLEQRDTGPAPREQVGQVGW